MSKKIFLRMISNLLLLEPAEKVLDNLKKKKKIKVNFRKMKSNLVSLTVRELWSAESTRDNEEPTVGRQHYVLSTQTDFTDRLMGTRHSLVSVYN